MRKALAIPSSIEPDSWPMGLDQRPLILYIPPAVQCPQNRPNIAGSGIDGDPHHDFVFVIFFVCGFDWLNPQQMFGDLHRV